MAPTPPSPIWREVKAQSLAGIIVVIVASVLGGLAFLVYTVPRQLDEVLSNQTQFKGRMDKLEIEVDQHSDRLVRLEAKK